MTATEGSKTNRCYRSRFGMRALLLALAVICAWLAHASSLLREQVSAVNAIANAGGYVTYNFHSGDPTSPMAWRWLLPAILLGRDDCAVSFNLMPVDDSALQNLHRLN